MSVSEDDEPLSYEVTTAPVMIAAPLAEPATGRDDMTGLQSLLRLAFDTGIQLLGIHGVATSVHKLPVPSAA